MAIRVSGVLLENKKKNGKKLCRLTGSRSEPKRDQPKLNQPSQARLVQVISRLVQVELVQVTLG